MKDLAEKLKQIALKNKKAELVHCTRKLGHLIPFIGLNILVQWKFSILCSGDARDIYLFASIKPARLHPCQFQRVIGGEIDNYLRSQIDNLIKLQYFFLTPKLRKTHAPLPSQLFLNAHCAIALSATLQSYNNRASV